MERLHALWHGRKRQRRFTPTYGKPDCGHDRGEASETAHLEYETSIHLPNTGQMIGQPKRQGDNAECWISRASRWK